MEHRTIARLKLIINSLLNRKKHNHLRFLKASLRRTRAFFSPCNFCKKRFIISFDFNNLESISSWPKPNEINSTSSIDSTNVLVANLKPQ